MTAPALDHRFRLLLSLICCPVFCIFPAMAEDASLAENFKTPPKEVRPTYWWRFMDDYATREGIVAELDSFKRTGVQGAVVSYCSSKDKPAPPQAGMPYVPILSKEWWEMLRFNLNEAAKRNLDLWFQACPGYATSGGPWITAEHSMQKVVWSEVPCEGGKPFDAVLPVPQVDPQWNFYRDIAVLAYPAVPPKQAISPDSVIDLTGKMDASGKLTWEAPAGTWKIVRFGHTTTGVPVHPVTPAGSGLECDKLSKEATRIQFDNYFKKILALRPGQGKGSPGIHLFYDSWEAQNLNWTPRFREEFKKLRGYDPVPWLPVAAGQWIGSEDLSRRFDQDWRHTVEDLINSEHFAELARLCHENGSSDFRAQPYNGPINFMTAGALFDIPEGEFWYHKRDYGWWTLRMIASVSHVNGKKVAAAETLTSMPADHHNDADPFSTKAETDLALTMGINEFALHTATHNPWPKLLPGMVTGFFPPLVGRGQVWSDLSASWITYLSRCCYLLRQGLFSADAVRLFRPGQKGYEAIPGHALDLCNEELIISSMKWDGNALTLPGGMRYKVLELVDTAKTIKPELSPSGIERTSKKPRQQNISLPLLRKVRELVLAGATVVGPRPDVASGLSGYPESDREVAKIAEELWGPSSEKGPVDRKVGKGRVFSGIALPAVLEKIGVQPDFKTMEPVSPNDVPWIHRIIGEDDLYFISNQRNEPLKVTGSFRVDGKTPEFWNTDTGTVEPVPAWTRKDGRTEVTLDFAPRESLFVRFRPGTQKSLPVDLPEPVVQDSIPLSKGWKVAFDPAMGAPAEADFSELVSWTDRPEKEIRYYSGIATYRRDVTLPDGFLKSGNKAILNLGEVKNLARVTVNGTTFPELWKPPFTCDITKALKPGANKLSIEIVNLWANRLVGDEQEPPDVEWGKPRNYGKNNYAGRQLKSYPDWLVQGTPRPSKERRTFTTWSYIKKDQPLLPSGLLGPVTLNSISPKAN